MGNSNPNSNNQMISPQNISKNQQENAQQPNNQEVNITEFILHKIKTSEDIQSQSQSYQTLYLASLSNQQLNRALGCIFGSLIGDALGAFCQFSQSVNDKLLNKVMTMPGGGAFSLKIGQFTDDSQMASHLLSALTKIQTHISLAEQIYPLLRHIALQYLQWFNSDPFDIGITCRKGLSKVQSNENALRSRQQPQLSAIFDKIFNEVYQDNKDSQSNGSLMRIAPMAAFLSSLNQNPINHTLLIKSEIKMIHPKPILQNAGLLWVTTLYKVIKRPDNTPNTFKTLFKEVENISEAKEIADWFKQAKKEQPMSGKVNIGWAKIAWTYGMNCLHQLGTEQKILNKDYYEKVIKSVIKQAGDTDTNAAIVGGLLGALVGFSNLPSYYLHKMLSLTFQKNTESQIMFSQNRPRCYQPFQVLLKTLDLFKLSQQYTKCCHPKE